jgi:hypothetical protein
MTPSMIQEAKAEKKTLGPYTFKNNKDHGAFSTVPMEGNQVLLELYMPAYVDETPFMTIAHIVHGYRELRAGRSGTISVFFND